MKLNKSNNYYLLTIITTTGLINKCIDKFFHAECENEESTNGDKKELIEIGNENQMND